MKTENNKDPFQIGTGDRILLSMISLCVLLMFLLPFYHLMRWKPEEPGKKILKIAIVEGNGALIIFSAAAFLYAIFKVRWFENVIRTHLLRVVVVMFILLGIIFFSLIFVMLHD